MFIYKQRLFRGVYRSCESFVHNVKLSNLHKIGKYDKEIGENRENYQQNGSVSIDIVSAPATVLLRI